MSSHFDVSFFVNVNKLIAIVLSRCEMLNFIFLISDCKFSLRIMVKWSRGEIFEDSFQLESGSHNKMQIEVIKFV